MFLPPILSSSMETHVTMTTLLTSSPLEVIFFFCVVGMEVLANGPSVALQGDDTTKHEMSSQLDYSTAPHNPVEMSVPTSKNPDTLAMVQAEMVLFPTFPQPELVIATKSGISKENAFSTLDLSSPLPPSSLETHVTMAPLLTSSSMAIVTTNYKEDHGPTTIMFLPPILSSSEEIHGTCTTLGLAPSCYSPALSDPVDMWEDEEDFLALWGSTPHNDTGDMSPCSSSHKVTTPSDLAIFMGGGLIIL